MELNKIYKKTLKLACSLSLVALAACTGGGDQSGDQNSEDANNAGPGSSIQNFSISPNGKIELKLLNTTQSGEPIECDEDNNVVHIDIMGDDGEYVRQSSDKVIFKCTEQGQGQVAMVIDNTGSVTPVMDNIKTGASSLVDQVFLGNGSASLTRVSTNSKICSEMSSDENEIKTAVQEQLFAGNGWTALYDGIRMGNETLERAGSMFTTSENNEATVCGSQPNKAIVVFTDGNENNSADEKSYKYDRSRFPGDYIDTTLDDLKDLKVEGSQVPMYTIGMGVDVDHAVLNELATDSGGRHFVVDDGDGVEAAFEIISTYFNATASICTNIEQNFCGSRNVRVTHERTVDGVTSSEVSSYTAEIPCGDEIDNNKVVETVDVTEEATTSVSGTELESSLEKRLYLPGFDNELGTRELTSVIISYDLTSSVEVLSNSDLQTSASGSDQTSLKSRFRYQEFNDTTPGEIADASVNATNGVRLKINENALKGLHVVQSHDFYKFVNQERYAVDLTNASNFTFLDSFTGDLINKLNGSVSVTYHWREIANPSVKILDPALEAMIRKNSGNKFELLTYEDILKIVKLDISGRNISSLEGLQFFVNLEELIISRNQISNLKPLSNLSKLKKLVMDDNSISDLSFIAGLQNLEHLSAKYNSISDVSHLSQLTNLKKLYLSNNSISDISDLAGLSNLKELSLSKNLISDISACSSLVNLEKLYLVGNKDLQDLSSLTSLTKLYYLNLSSILNLSLTRVSQIASLKTLVLNGTKIQDYSLLVNNANLVSLYIKNNNLNSLASLAGTSLTYLNASGNSLTDANWSEINALTSLVKLYVDSNSFQVVGDLSALQALYIFSAKSNQITNFDSLSQLAALQIISLGSNSISDLSILSNMTGNIKKVYFSSNQISDISAVSSLTNLVEISVGDNANISDMSALSNLSSLKKIWFFNTLVSSVDFIVNLLDLTYISLKGAPINCDAQKIIVNRQYEGLSASYNLVPGCEFIYDEETPNPTVTITQETQVFNLNQFNVFTANQSATQSQDNNAQSTNFAAFDSIFGERILTEVKVIYNMSASVETALFQLNGTENIGADLNTQYSMGLSSTFTAFAAESDSLNVTENFVLANSSNFTEQELDEIVESSDSVIPLAVENNLVISGEYSFSEQDVNRVAQGETPQFNIVQDLLGNMQNIADPATQALFRGVLQGEIKLEYTYSEAN